MCRLCCCFKMFLAESLKFISFKLLKCLIELSLSVKISIFEEAGVTIRAVNIAIVFAREDEGHFSTDEVKSVVGLLSRIKAKPKVILQDSFLDQLMIHRCKT